MERQRPEHEAAKKLEETEDAREFSVVSQPRDSGQGPVRILIVEDDCLISEGLRDACHEAGYDVVGIAVDAAQAISVAERERPDLVLMDIQLSGGSDGVEAASLLRERFGIRSIFTTAHSDPHTLERGKRADPAGWLVKPYDGTRLLHVMQRALNSAF
jgi:DNA-binding NarL/FixJ family response regulator